jgi:hypothetical protein
LSEENRANAKAGQFVFPGNWSDDVTGFISEVDTQNDQLEICLFAPSKNLPDEAVVLDECMSFEDTVILLRNIIDEDHIIREMWLEVIAEQESMRGRG